MITETERMGVERREKAERYENVAGVASGYDVIVVGAGAAGMTAACVAAAEGRSVLLLEQASVVGGTSAISGGMVWIPANHKMAAAGVEDDLEKARTYLSHAVPSGSPERMEAFLTRGDEAIRYLEAKTSVRLRPVPIYPDYYPMLPGSVKGARVLEPLPFNGRALGACFALLRDPLPEFMLFGGMMISREDIPHLRRIGRSLRSTLHVCCLLVRYAWQRLSSRRGTTLYLGNALIARLLHSALDLGVDIRIDSVVRELRTCQDRVVGVDAIVGGEAVKIEARAGVILATGGISRDAEIKRRYVPPAGTLSATIDRGLADCGARLAAPLDAQMSDPAAGSAFWVPVSMFTRRDGSVGVFPHTVTDRGKPGLIAVGRNGRRFVNEALSYHEFGLAQLRGGEAVNPAHLICDKEFLWKYGLGRIRPFAIFVKEELENGYLKRADTVEGLAEAIGVSPSGLSESIARFNMGAGEGKDPEFGRGGDTYQRHLGDGDVTPNPCVRPIITPPFYSVAVVPADLGMSAGMVTNAHAQVLRKDGAIIPGLFACGNDMQSVMNGAYPGPGITLGPSLTFGYVAAMTAIAPPPRNSA